MSDDQNKKVIWIINQYAGAFSDVAAGRHFNFARGLVSLGYEVFLVMAARSHLFEISDLGPGRLTCDVRDGINLVYVDVPAYSRSSSVKRVLGWFLFSRRLSRLEALLEKKPDVIYYSSLSLVGYLGAEKLSRKLDAPIIFEVRDIWPLTLVELGGVSRWHPLVIFLQWIEDAAYKKSTYFFSNLENLPEHIGSRVKRSINFEWIPNGVNQYDSTMLPDYHLQFPDGHFVVGYTGSIGTANSMITLIESAKELQGEKISFVIAGDGEQLASLRGYVEENNLLNVHFLGRIPKTDVPALLQKFDACYIGWGNNPLYRFGIGANKIPEYLYSGKPILHSYSGGADPVSKYQAGITIPAEDSKSLSQAILALKDMPESERAKMGANGRSAAEQHYLFSAITKKIDSALREVING